MERLMRAFMRASNHQRPQVSRNGRDSLVSFAQRLVRTPSLSTQEGEVALAVQEELARLGVGGAWVDRVGNVVVRIGNEAGPTLLFNAHMDTVAVTDSGAWEHDPLGGVVKNGVLYGLGATDMKGAVAAMVYAAGLLQPYADALRGNAVFAFVVQEEPCEGMAMRVLVEEEGVRPAWVVLGEPTDLQVSRGHRGRVMLKVTTFGRSSHGSQPEQGDNAVYSAARLIFGVEMMAGTLGNDPVLGPGTVALTQISSRSASLNAVPDQCTFYLDRRLTLGETPSGALMQVEALIARENIQATAEITRYCGQSYTGYACEVEEAFPRLGAGRGSPARRPVPAQRGARARPPAAHHALGFLDRRRVHGGRRQHPHGGLWSRRPEPRPHHARTGAGQGPVARC
ncbi:MAG: M20/M25/M40 family metallo-hydrolase [Anaerolineae bacterium]|nr:M20/M25/M40 family metallo-hydrolase [Anaerolineae bacterium]